MEEQMLAEEVVINSIPTYFVEDDTRMALSFATRLNDVIDDSLYARDAKTAIVMIKECVRPAIFWIDIHLAKKNFEGISVLEVIEQACPDSLVIVYTAYGDTWDRCKKLKLKRFHFFEKSTSTSTEDFESIKGIITSYRNDIIDNSVGEGLMQYYAQIAHVDEERGWVKLECHVDGEIVDSTIPRESFGPAMADSLMLDMWVLVNVTRYGSGTRIRFSKANSVPDEIRNEIKDDDVDDVDFDDPAFWKAN